MKVFVMSFLLAILCLFQTPLDAFRFVIYGDSRASTINPPFNTAVLTYINAQVTQLSPLPSFVYFLGDSVRRAKSAGHSYLHDWHDFMTTTLQGIPLYMVVGNSDIYGDTGWTEYARQVEYQAEFNTMPSNGPSDLYKYLTYSFEYGEGDTRSLFVIVDSFLVTADNVTHYDNDIDATQIAWVKAQTAASTAPHKFVFSHGPFFSTEGWPVGNGVRQVWDSSSSYDLLFCSHEHIYSRWALYPMTGTKGAQILTGTNGAPIDPVDNSHHVNVKAHPYYGYNFVVVDVDGKKVTLHAYGVSDLGGGNYSTQLIDTLRIAQ